MCSFLCAETMCTVLTIAAGFAGHAAPESQGDKTGSGKPIVQYDVNRWSTLSHGYVWVVTYGALNEQLLFAVFEGQAMARGPLKSRVTITSTLNRTSATLKKPDGTVVSLPTGAQLIGIVDEKLIETMERVTLAELKAFLESKSNGYTINALIQFAASRRKQGDSERREKTKGDAGEWHQGKNRGKTGDEKPGGKQVPVYVNPCRRATCDNIDKGDPQARRCALTA